MKYYLIYWWKVAKRWARWPFSRWVRAGAVPLAEYLAGLECDPATRRALVEARSWRERWAKKTER